MATKRLTFDVSEELHSRLKAEAAALGTALGAHCATILQDGSPKGGLPGVEDMDTATLSAMPLGVLREMCQDLGETKPTGWEIAIRRVQSEIKRRYKV